MKTTFNLLRIFVVLFLLLCLFDSTFAPYLSPLLIWNAEISDTEEAVSLSIQLNKRTIQDSSFPGQSFPMLVSNKINKLDLSSFPRNPVDLVCVFQIKDDPSIDTQIEDIQNLFTDLRPLMTDQDRLAVVLFHPSYGSYSFIDDRQMEDIPSLVNTTAKNWENIIGAVGEKMIKISPRKIVKAASNILKQRPETNRTTGIFISSDSIYPDYWRECYYAPDKDRIMDEIDDAKEDAGVQDKRWIIQIFPEPEGLGQAFAEGLVALRAGIVETRLLLKPEESELLKNVRILNSYFDLWCKGWEEENEGFMKRSLSAKSGGEEEYAFDLAIPKIAAQDLLSSPMEVKVASYQLAFLLENGSQVVMKNEDLVVRIVREGEKITDEDESRDVARNFYFKWGKNWMIRMAWRPISEGHNYEKAKRVLERFKHSLDDSIVKDDEMLQNLWKDAEEDMILDQEMGAEHDI